MIAEHSENNAAIEAVIYLKNGTRKYGMILQNSIADIYHFISNADYKQFDKTKNGDFIEAVHEGAIEKIDTFQK